MERGNSLPFMKPKAALSHFQQPANQPYPQPNNIFHNPPSCFFKMPFNIILTSMSVCKRSLPITPSTTHTTILHNQINATQLTERQSSHCLKIYTANEGYATYISTAEPNIMTQQHHLSKSCLQNCIVDNEYFF